MKIPCSSCNQRLEIPEELAGQTIDCPACNATLAVPALETPPPAVPQVQESAPQAASSKKSKSSIPKWAIASVAGIAVVVVGLIMFFPDKAVKTDEESQRPSPPAESKPVEPVAKASQPEPPTVKAPDISIHDAALEGNIEAVKQHLAAGTDVNAKILSSVFKGDTPLDWAETPPLDWAKTETAALLRKHGGKTGAWLDADKSIHTAARAGHIEAVKQHLAAGADVNAKLDRGYTALQFAAGRGHKEIAELLIAEGADVNAKDDDGDTPLDQAILDKQTETADLLRKHGGKTKRKLEAELTEPVAEASQPEPPTAEAPAISIHHAARYGQIEAVKQHLAAGTDVNAKDAAGWMPLDWVEEGKHTEIADLLRKHGGKTQDWFKAGDSIHIAAGAGHIEAVKQHLVDGANVNARRATGDAPLHVAALGGRKEVAELLISKGADVNAKILSGGIKGETPLDFAIIRNHTEFADLLRKHGGKTGEELKAEGK
jgi:cytohesin